MNISQKNQNANGNMIYNKIKMRSLLLINFTPNSIHFILIKIKIYLTMDKIQIHEISCKIKQVIAI